MLVQLIVNGPNTLWTIGHSNRSIEDFLQLLQENHIAVLADVRHLPGSKYNPQFNAETLKKSLERAGIQYAPFIGLGGKRYSSYKKSRNNRWRNASFRSYADYMELPQYAVDIDHLSIIATAAPTAIMCAEAVWWRCHRSMISDLYKSYGTKVLHIMAAGKEPKEHPYTQPALIVDGELSYHDADLLDLVES